MELTNLSLYLWLLDMFPDMSRNLISDLSSGPNSMEGQFFNMCLITLLSAELEILKRWHTAHIYDTSLYRSMNCIPGNAPSIVSRIFFYAKDERLLPCVPG